MRQISSICSPAHMVDCIREKTGRFRGFVVTGCVSGSWWATGREGGLVNACAEQGARLVNWVVYVKGAFALGDGQSEVL